jgi:[ribosomal protein S18]-alanine N-acetyltransferase
MRPSPSQGSRPERPVRPVIFGARRSAPSVIRLLRPDRAQACARLHAEGFAHPWSPEELTQLIASSSTVGAAALDPVSGRLRGFVLSRLAADEAEILTIAVEAAHQGAGVGRALLSENLRQVANAGAGAMFLEVAMDNAAALALYERFGFVKVGQRAGYYRRADGTRATAVVMRKSLR